VNFFLKVAAVIFVSFVFSFADWTGGSTQPSTMTYNGGTYYKISTADELAWFASKVNGGTKSINAKLIANITLSSTQKWTPISGFNGIFDGGGFTVSKVYVPFSTGSNMNNQAGFFGSISSSGVVKNLFLTSVNVNARADVTYAGGLVAYNSGKVLDCSVGGSVAAKNTNYDVAKLFSYAGGIAGYNAGIISAVYSTASADAQTTMTTYGSATPATYAGGIVGYNKGSVLDAKGGSSKLYSTSLYGNPYAGGIAAYNEGTIKNSFAYSSSYTGSTIGGVVGHNAGTVTNSFTDQTKKNTNGIGGGTTSGASKRTTANMQTADFTKILNTSNNTENDRGVWKYVSGNYPTLTGMVSGYVTYKITFSANGSTTYAYTKANGTVDLPANPTSSDGEFVGWFNSAGSKVDGTTVWTGDATVIAKFEVVKWDVSFVDFDGQEISTQSVKNNTMPTIPSDPTRQSTVQWNYEFSKWTPSVVVAVAPAEYKAVYDSSLVKYHLVVNAGDLHIDEDVDYGYEFELPVAPDSAGYTFDGWYAVGEDGEPAERLGDAGDKITVTGEINVVGKYNVNYYTVEFFDYDGRKISGNDVMYNTMPTIPADPTRQSTVQWNYKFSKWSPSVVVAVAPAEYKAVYDSSLVKYHLVVNAGDLHIDEDVDYGYEFELPVAPDSTGYTFDGWYAVGEDGEPAERLGGAGDKITVTGEINVVGVYKENNDSSSSATFESSSSDAAECSSSAIGESSSSNAVESSSSVEQNSSSSDIFGFSSSSVNSISSSSFADCDIAPSSSSAKTESESSSSVESRLSSAYEESDVQSSSSNVKSEESDKGEKDDKNALLVAGRAPQFRIAAVGRSLKISGVPRDSKVAIFDVHGNVMYTGVAYATNFAVSVSNAGGYLVRVGGQTLRVNVK